MKPFNPIDKESESDDEQIRWASTPDEAFYSVDERPSYAASIPDEAFYSVDLVVYPVTFDPELVSIPDEAFYSVDASEP